MLLIYHRFAIIKSIKLTFIIMSTYRISTDIAPYIIADSIADKKYILAVRDLPDNEKPREKLIKDGPLPLSTVELVAIVLGTGTRREEVFTMASRLLREYGEKAIYQQRDPKVIMRELKIPEAKACQIVACFELGRRFYQKRSGSLVTIHSARQAFDYLQDMRNLQKEQFRVLYLNSRYQLVHDEVVSLGTFNASIVQIREIFKPALEYSAAAIIVAHNHPSGVLKATRADVELTEKIVAAGKIMDIEVLDHIVIAKNKFISIF